MKLSVGLASHDMVPFKFAYDLMCLTMHTISNLDENTEFGVVKVQGTYVHSARQQLLQAALHKGSTHLLWIDTDMAFPKDAALKLLAHGKPFVGINYCNRGLPYEFVGIKRVSWDPGGVTEKLITAKDSKGLEECEALGFGMFLMDLDVVRSFLPDLDEKPWFWFDWISGRRQVGEDVRFCKMITDAGHKIFCDHDLSRDCAHIGLHEHECVTAEVMMRPEVVEAMAAL